MYAMASVGDREMPARQCTNAQLLDSRTLSVHSTQHAGVKRARNVAKLSYLALKFVLDHPIGFAVTNSCQNSEFFFSFTALSLYTVTVSKLDCFAVTKKVKNLT